MSQDDIWRWSAAKTARRIRRGRISASAVTQAHIDRLNHVNPHLNAVVYDMSAQARAQALEADKLQACGARLGPLHGVPVTIKSNVDCAGMPNPNGVKAAAGNIAKTDSPVVANLRKAGAIVLGLTNTPEFSFRAVTDNPLHGLTLNPWDESATCGGSSGGAASALAAGVGAIAHGNDIGGSLRWPAHCCGLTTIKPTQGRIAAYVASAPVERAMLSHLMSSQGPLARSVEDARLALKIMSARDPRDPWQVPAPFDGPKASKPIRLAKAKIPADMEVDPEIRAIYDQAADSLANAGYAVEEIELPDLDGVWRLWLDILMTETHTLADHAIRTLASADFMAVYEDMLKSANLLDRVGFMRAIAARTSHMRAWQMFFETFPVILAPTTLLPTPGVRADLEGKGGARRLFWQNMRFISAINVLGLPSAVVPVDLANGLPVGVQLIAGRYREDLCLNAAQAIEDAAGRVIKKLWRRERAQNSSPAEANSDANHHA